MKTDPIDLSLKAQRRAAYEIRRSHAKPRGAGGRPLKGGEPRKRFSYRWEPTMVEEIEALTGLNPGALLERLHPILKAVAEYRRSRDRVIAAVEALIAAPLDKAS